MKLIKMKKSGTYSRLLKKHRQRLQRFTSCRTSPPEVDTSSLSELPSESQQENPDLVKSIKVDVEPAAMKYSLGTELGTAIQQWATEHKITQTALKSLIGILKQNLNVNLPGDPRTLMKTPRKLTIISMSNNGQYWHQGFEICLRKVFQNLNQPVSISINVNVDGLPVYKSSIKNFWPILCSIHEFPEISPLVVGIFFGISKPSDVTEFLTPFIEEILPILTHGLTINGYLVSVKIRCFICDTPARSFIKGVTNFNGKYGCIKCKTKGKYSHLSNTMVYSDINSPKRTNKEFREKMYTDHQRKDTPLTKLPIDLIEDVIVSDSLHLMELGVMRKLLNSWRTGKMNKKAKWSVHEKENISEFLVNVRFPTEMHRRMRSLEFVSLWKGLEYRNFLNYAGLVILKSYLPEKYYEH